MTEPDRLTAAVSALAGGVFWGMFHLATTLWAGQPVTRQAIVVACANVAMAGVGGVLAAYFLAPAVAPLIPVPTLRDLHAVGFGIGALAWEAAPFVYRLLRLRAEAEVADAGHKPTVKEEAGE
jgi:hypothetical protein